MVKKSCPQCGWLFEENSNVKAHNKRCPAKAIKSGPSFKSKLSKGLRKTRASITGTYEWALIQKNNEASKSLKQYFNSLPLEKIESEILRLEKSLLEDASSQKRINRLIAFSHAHLVAFELANKQDRKAAVKELKEKLKPDTPKSSDLLDLYYKSGQRAVLSGGLPSLGKRK